MKKGNLLFFPVACLLVFLACNNSSTSVANTEDPGTKKDSVASPVKANFNLGVQMWTFRMFSVTDALKKVDSAGIKHIEQYITQPLGGDLQGNFGPDMSAETRSKLKQLLQSKGIQIVAMGVIVPKTREDWVKTFELAKDFGLSYITSEPIKSQWDMVDSLAGIYSIKVAIHDHPRPNVYWHPDSVLAAIKGHRNIGACADIGHWARNGLDPVECLKKLEGHIIGVHLKDIVKFNDTKAADTIVSKGVIDVPAVLAELKRQNFSGMLSIEHESNWYHNLPEVIFTREYFDAQVAKLK